MEKTEILKKIIESNEWTYYGKNFYSQKRDTIAINTTSFAKASEVFKAMKLNMNELLKIDSSSKVKTLVTDLKKPNHCQIFDKKWWLKLSQLTEKTIHFYFLDDSCMGSYVCTYLPNGKIKKIGLIQQFFHFLLKKFSRK